MTENYSCLEMYRVNMVTRIVVANDSAVISIMSDEILGTRAASAPPLLVESATTSSKSVVPCSRIYLIQGGI